MPLASLLSPPRCVSCLARGHHPWCPRCLDEVRWLDEGGCQRCASPRHDHDCWPSWVPVSSTTALAVYEGPVADAVVTGKVHGAVAVWRVLGRRLGAVLDATEYNVAVPIPTDRLRARRRGHDHALMLAEAVAAMASLPARPLLTAVGPLPDRGSTAGPSPPAPAFRARMDLSGARMLLVDDVLTTGTTAAAAARVAIDAGAVRVGVAVVGRAGGHVDVEPPGPDQFRRGHSLSPGLDVR